MATELQLEQRVTRGVRLLDRKLGPNWPKKVKVTTLNVANENSCVIGQAHPKGWDDGIVDLGIDKVTPSGVSKTVTHGFDCDPTLTGFEEDQQYALLAKIWKRVIRGLRADIRAGVR